MIRPLSNDIQSETFVLFLNDEKTMPSAFKEDLGDRIKIRACNGVEMDKVNGKWQTRDSQETGEPFSIIEKKDVKGWMTAAEHTELKYGKFA